MAVLVARFEAFCLASGILAIAGLTIVNVLSRAFLGRSLPFAHELTQFSMIFVTFFGIGYAASRGRHIRMTAIHDTLPLRARKVVMLGITATTSALLLVLTWLALDYVFGTVRALGSVSPVLRVPLYLVYLAAPIGFFLGAVQYALACYKNWVEPEVYLSFEERDGYDDETTGEIRGR